MNSKLNIFGLSLAMAAWLLAGSCGSSATSSEQSADTTISADSVTTRSTQTPVSETLTLDEINPTELLLDFATAWDAADWDSLGSLATSNVVEVAMEWYEEGGNAGEGLSTALEHGCLDVFDTGLTCQFVYAPPEGRGLIFNVTYTNSHSGPMVVDLLFGGEAG